MHCFYLRTQISDTANSFIHPFQKHISIVGTVALLTKLSAAVVEGPADSDHMGIRLTTGKVLHRNLLIDLKNSEKNPVKQKPRDDFQEIFDT